MTLRNGWLIQVCVNCMLHHANGECGGCHDDVHGHDCEPWSAVDFATHDVTMGIGTEDHSENCIVYVLNDLKARFPDLTWPEVPGDYECDCARDTYSTSQCDGCGSWLHGPREGFYLWEREAVNDDCAQPDPTVHTETGPNGETIAELYARFGVAPCQHCGQPGGH